MNSIKKAVTVRFFRIEAEEAFIHKFAASFRSLIKLNKGADVVTTPLGRYVISCIDAKDSSVRGREMLFWSSVKERNTWQVRVRQDGQIAGIEDANSIVGDASFFKFDPEQKVIAAFTTYSPVAYLRSMCSSVLRRLTSESARFSIDYLSDDAAIEQVTKWDYYSKMSIKLAVDRIAPSDDLPDLIRALLDIKAAFGSSEISVTLDRGHDDLPKKDVTETINYLSSSEGCSYLTLTGGMRGQEAKSLPINLKRAFVKYRSVVELKAGQKYIHSEQASSILSDAFLKTANHLS